MNSVFKPLAGIVLTAIALHSVAATTYEVNSAVGLDPGAAHQASTSSARREPNPLIGGAEIFENLTESATALKGVAFNKSLSDFKTLYPEISQRLSPDRKRRLDALVAGVRSAWQKGDRATMALQSIEAYRLLQEAIDHHGQPVPVEVALLDYAGFKIHALLLSTHPDWAEVSSTARQAATWWTAIGPKLTDPALRAAMDHTIDGIRNAAARKDRMLLGFAAKMDLILVDGLEGFFTSHPAT